MTLYLITFSQGCYECCSSAVNQSKDLSETYCGHTHPDTDKPLTHSLIHSAIRELDEPFLFFIFCVAVPFGNVYEAGFRLTLLAFPRNLLNPDNLDRCLCAALSTSSGLQDEIASGPSSEVTYPCSS